MNFKATADSGLGAFQGLADAINKNGRREMARALNEVGAETRKATISAEATETGLSARLIGRAQREVKATATRLEYRIEARGGDLRIKNFAPRATASGVVAKVWGVPMEVRGGFFMSRSGSRRDVFVRAGAARLPINSARTGRNIPEGMASGSSLEAFAAGSASAGEVVLRRLARLVP